MICSLVRAYPKTLLGTEGGQECRKRDQKIATAAGAIATSGRLRKSVEQYPFLVDVGCGAQLCPPGRYEQR
ncbi:hypothetical protein MESS4_330119 [Mesorhizobium sp. STM 4661]|nr:hypothetical protein MESS4_330119 [Mesorhizobium sp. STM 4661]